MLSTYRDSGDNVSDLSDEKDIELQPLTGATSRANSKKHGALRTYVRELLSGPSGSWSYESDRTTFRSSSDPSSSLLVRGSRLITSRARHGYVAAKRLLPSTLHRLLSQLCNILCILSIGLGCILFLAAAFFPSYTHVPSHYQDFRHHVATSNIHGSANLNSTRIFIAASLYDPEGGLVSGAWGRAVLQLIDMLGPSNTFLSIYESDSGKAGADALQKFGTSVPCEKRLLSQDSVTLVDAPAITMPDGELAVKRIAYLAAARNIALEPLQDQTAFDKILYLNDVYFDPIEAAQLLFLTNSEGSGQSTYNAACAADFDNPWKYYDTLATRDTNGFSLGLPIYPWFTESEDGASLEDVLAQKDAVRVKSCWGGMVAFDARLFQGDDTQPSQKGPPITFRSEPELDWEYSECCLVHADIAALNLTDSTSADSGIYMNPYIRTAYDARTFRWLSLGRRTERLLQPIQAWASYFLSLPRSNKRRSALVGQTLQKTVWSADNGGSWSAKSVEQGPGGFCGVQNLLVHRLQPKKGEKNWIAVPLPLEPPYSYNNRTQEPQVSLYP